MKKAYLAFSENYSKNALKALEPEAKEGMNGVQVEISLENSEIEVSSEDTSDLRAALNSYLRWLNISKEITDGYEL